eukprot:358413-Chlamydomonas_euryale.AAC.4
MIVQPVRARPDSATGASTTSFILRLCCAVKPCDAQHMRTLIGCAPSNAPVPNLTALAMLNTDES